MSPTERSAAGPDDPGLETRLKRIEQIVSSLEGEDLDLEKALKLFEEGVSHVRAAERMLAEAELKVEELLGQGDRTRPVAGGE